MSLHRIAAELSKGDTPPFGGLLALGAAISAQQANDEFDEQHPPSKDDEA